jgi:hypothetical protein
MPFNNQGQQQGGLRQQFGQQQQGQSEQWQKQDKPQKQINQRANVNAGHMLPSADGYDTKVDVSGFTGHTDVTPHVAGGAVQIVGGVRPPESKAGDEVENNKDVGSAPVPPNKTGQKGAAQPADAADEGEGGLSGAVQQVYGKDLKGGKKKVKPKK